MAATPDCDRRLVDSSRRQLKVVTLQPIQRDVFRELALRAPEQFQALAVIADYILQHLKDAS